ncbi:penicillin-binding transpeptidase domain-containing protein [Paenibacillus konkukensis]|uniref:penicillin-binding transpeptidase domain-containing protein n=1 Tax=Paenibacillus konkukensis TaxID=2020716 RepID=UPI00201E616C|nr:penicillin-binding transpeptidase domain-containing protein [Paenibacillus konkukensis]
MGRLYWVQIIEGKWLLAEAQKKWETEEVLRPVRGTITDRNDKVLAEDAPAYTIALNPDMIRKYHLDSAVTTGLASVLNTSDDPADLAALQEKIRSKIVKTYSVPNPQVEIRNEGWKIDAEVAEQIKQMVEEWKKQADASNIGVYLLKDTKRFYPGGKMAAQLLGYSDKENKAVMGLEAMLDSDLKGVPGSLTYEKDLNGVELPDSKVSFVPAIDGNNVRLTIDKNIQYYIESALEKAYNQWHPKSMTAIAADPNTMEILGMASYPNFNPNQYWNSKPQDFQNNAVASQYEPGSTFKLVTLAGAVEEGIFNPNDSYMSGSIKVPGNILHDYNTSWGPITYLEGLKRSSNVAFVKLGYEKLGKDKLKSYIDKFGFGAKTGIDVPGEVAGMVAMKNPVEFATATYGQGLTATSIQQTAAYAAIANGGKLMQPHVVKEVYNPKTKEVVRTIEPKVIRQVVSEATAKQVSEYLETVVSDQKIGTGKKAAIEGYRVAGKTGTANKVEPGKKGYAPDKWVMSFIGYAPVEAPKILVTIIADEPDVGGDFHLGSDVTLPAFKEIVSQTLRYMGIPSSAQQMKSAEKEIKVMMPDLAGMTMEQAKIAMNKYGVSIEAIGKGTKIVEQSPAPGTEIGAAERIYVTMQGSDDLTIPNLTGKSLRDALEVCSFLNAKCQSTGEGYVASQTVESEGDVKIVTLQLKPYNELLQTPPPADSSDGKKDKASGTAKSGDSSKAQDTPDKKVVQQNR